MIENLGLSQIVQGFEDLVWVLAPFACITAGILLYRYNRKVRDLSLSTLNRVGGGSRVDYRLNSFSNPMRQGYLRSLTADRATLVTDDREVKKGTKILVSLRNLHHELGQESPWFPARVTNIKTVSGDLESYLVNIQFARQDLNPSELGSKL